MRHWMKGFIYLYKPQEVGMIVCACCKMDFVDCRFFTFFFGIVASMPNKTGSCEVVRCS